MEKKIKWISSLDHCCGDTDVVANMMLLLFICNSIDQFYEIFYNLQ